MLHADFYPGLKNSSLTLILVLLFLSSLSACGKKGGLYLPAEPEPVVKTEAKIVAPIEDPEGSEDLQDSKKKPSEPQ